MFKYTALLHSTRPYKITIRASSISSAIKTIEKALATTATTTYQLRSITRDNTQ